MNNKYYWFCHYSLCVYRHHHVIPYRISLQFLGTHTLFCHLSLCSDVSAFKSVICAIFTHRNQNLTLIAWINMPTQEHGAPPALRTDVTA